MKTKKLAVIAGVLTMFIFGSCSKYDEGPAISLKSKKERVANTWVIEEAFREGEDVTGDYDEFTLKTTTDGDASLAALYSWGDFSYEYETQGTWSFESNKENISFDYENDDADAEYQILKLEEESMWVREKGGEDELHLISK